MKPIYLRLLLFFCLCLIVEGLKAQNGFITLWNTAKMAGPTGTKKIHFNGAGNDYTLIVKNLTKNITAVPVRVSAPGISIEVNDDSFYEITALNGQGQFHSFLAGPASQSEALVEIKQWGGDIEWSTMRAAFKGCSNLQITATDKPNLSKVLDMSEMFAHCTQLQGHPSMKFWDVSKVTNMAYLFAYTNHFNQVLNSWNTQQVQDMTGMFFIARAFNQMIGNWNLKSQPKMHYMLDSTGMDCMAYTKTLDGWAIQNHTPAALTLDARGCLYSSIQETGRNNLLAKEWIINDMTPDGGTCFASKTTLPISFGDIQAGIKNGILELRWLSIWETDNTHYEIEASLDGTNFIKIGNLPTLADKGIFTVPLEYHFKVALHDIQKILLNLPSILGLLFMGFQRRKYARMYSLGIVCWILLTLGCKKADPITPDPQNLKVQLRIAQVDPKGFIKHSKVIQAFVE